VYCECNSAAGDREKDMIPSGAEKDVHVSGLDSEFNLRGFADAMPAGVFLVQNRRIMYVNTSFAEMTGYSEDEVVGKDVVSGLLHPEDGVAVAENMVVVLSGAQKSLSCRCRLIRKDGGVTGVEGKFSFTIINSRPALICTAVDISENKRLKKERAELLSMVTHDFKSPLSTIMGYAELIAAGESGDMDIKEMAEAIHKSGRKLLDMVEDFQFHAKLDTGNITPRFAPADLNKILKEVQGVFRLQAAAKRLSVAVDSAGNMAMFFLDGRLIERALFNLVQNAVNYTPEGGRVTIKAERMPGEDGGSVRISVSDTGPGIPDEQAPKLFDLYFRSPYTRNIRGAGMGLTIVKAVAQAHGGRVELLSRHGKGSTFSMILPVMPVSA